MATQIFYISNGKIVADWKAIDNIFIHSNEEYNRLKVIVFCGLPRKGKSTLCNLLLQTCKLSKHYFDEYETNPNLNSNPKQNSVKVKKNVLLNLFSTNISTETHTNGIWITREPLVYDNNGEKVAVFIVDCQGVYGTDMDDINGFNDQKIFVLGSLMASNLIYNVDKIMNKSDEQLLITYLSSAKTLIKSEKPKAFQTLTLLMRDWTYDLEYQFGWDGGDNYYKNIKSTVKKNLIEESVDCVQCFLMPEPDHKAKNRAIHLTLDDFGHKFVKYVSKFSSKIMSEKDPTYKRIGESLVNGAEFVNFLRYYFVKIESEQFAEIISLHTAHSEITNLDLCERFFGVWQTRVNDRYHAFISDFKFANFEAELAKLKSMTDIEKNYVLSEFRQKSLNGGVGVKNYFVMLNEYIALNVNGFAQNATAFNTAWFMYKQAMNNYLKKAEDSVSLLVSREAVLMHRIFLKTSFAYYKDNCANTGDNFETRFAEIIKEKAGTCFESSRTNACYVRELLATHNKRLAEEFARRNFFDINSNKWIALHNEHFSGQLRKLYHNDSLTGNEFGVNFRHHFESKAVKFVEQRVSETFSKETKVTIGGAFLSAGALSGAVTAMVVIPGTVLAFTGIGVAFIGVAGIVSAGAYVAWRHFKQPRLQTFRQIKS